MRMTKTTTIRQWISGAVTAVISLVTMTVLLASCGINSSSTSTLTENQRILATCDATHPPATWVAIDGTGSSAASGIFAERMTALQSIVQRTAVCSGYLKIIVFSASSIASTTLFDGSLRQPGATSNARLQRVPKAVANVMTTVRRSYAAAAKHLSPDGSDINGQYEEASEWFQQLSGTYRLQLDLLTDGFQNVGGVNLGTHVLDQQQAIAVVARVPVPDLSGAAITVAGLGRVKDSTPSSAVVDGLVAYYNALCHRARAARCISVSDYQTAGW
jgi:hypothetical protein